MNWGPAEHSHGQPTEPMIGTVEIREAAEGRSFGASLLTEGRAAQAAGRRDSVRAPGSVSWGPMALGSCWPTVKRPSRTPCRAAKDLGRITLATPATPEIREAVDGGRRFMSVEFHALEERTTTGGVREVLRAYVPAVALVDRPEYDTTAAEVRQRGSMSGSMRMGRAVDCRCGPEGCTSALVEEVEVTAPDLRGFLGDYSQPLGPGTATVEGGRLVTSIDVAAGTSYADDLAKLIAAGTAPVIRPYPDPEKSVTRKDGTTLVYERLAVAALIATFTDQAAGFTPATLANERRDGRGLGRVERFVAVQPTTARNRGRRILWL